MDVVNESPICTFDDVAQIVEMPVGTLRVWARPTPRRAPLVHTAPNVKRGWPTIPLAGLVEARSLRAIRSLTSMQKIVPVVARLRERTNDEFVLAKPKLFVDNAGELFEHDSGIFVRIRDQQVQAPKIFDEYLRSIDLGPDNSPLRYKIQLKPGFVLYIDPRINAGRPSFPNGVPAFSILGAIAGGDSIRDVSEDFDLTEQQIEAALGDQERLARIA